MTDPLAEALWARLRNVLIALDRVDRLDTSADFVGWVEAFQCDGSQIQATARDWVLRAVRLASDPLNYAILSALRLDGSPMAQLMTTTNLTRVELTERVQDLARVGLMTQALDSDRVEATAAGQGMVAWLESVSDKVAEHARAGLTQDNPPPRIHRPPRSPLP